MILIKCIFVCLIVSVKVNGQETGFFWQITDIHYDPWYTNNPQSCHYNLTAKGKYGDFDCDSPWALVRSNVQAMVDMPQGRDADFILWTGDNAFHAIDPDVLSEELIIEITRNITDVIKEFFPDTLVIPVLGNHDFFPKNHLTGDGSPIYDEFADMWDSWLNDTQAKETFKKGSYFTIMLSKAAKARAVILNTNFYLPSNAATEGQDDPGNQFIWFEQVMDAARQNGEKVHLFTHVPVGKFPESNAGTSYLRPEQNDKLMDSIKSYCDIILGIYSAHTHHDSYKLFYDDNGTPICSMFVAPSTSPRIWRDAENPSAHNPALRRYTFQKSTYELIDIEQFSMDLNKANGNNDDEWIPLYSFKGTYGLTNVSTPQLQILLSDMKEYASDKFHLYYELTRVNTDHEINGPCSCSCKTSHMCSIEYIQYDEFDECYQEQAACSAATNSISILLIMVVATIYKFKL